MHPMVGRDARCAANRLTPCDSACGWDGHAPSKSPSQHGQPSPESAGRARDRLRGRCSSCRSSSSASWDLIGLGLVALRGLLRLRLLPRLGRRRGRRGAWPTAILFLFGGVGYLAPVAPVRRRRGDRRCGRCCRRSIRSRPARLLPRRRAHARAWRRGSLGLGPGDTPRDGFFDAAYLAPPRRPGGRVAVLGHRPRSSPQSALAHPLRLPAAGRRPAAHRRLDRRHRAAPPRESADDHHRPRAPSTGEFAAIATGRPAGDADPRRSRRWRPSPTDRRSRWCAPRTWRRPRSTASDATRTSTVTRGRGPDGRPAGGRRGRARGRRRPPALPQSRSRARRAGRAHADGQPPLGGHRGGRHRLHGCPSRPS